MVDRLSTDREGEDGLAAIGAKDGPCRGRASEGWAGRGTAAESAGQCRPR